MDNLEWRALLQIYLKCLLAFSQAVVLVFEQVLRTLSVMHEKGLVHAMLKPCSIWVDLNDSNELRATVAEYDLDKDLVSEEQYFRTLCEFVYWLTLTVESGV